MQSEISNVKKELQEGRFVIISTTGISMQPLLYEKKNKKATQVLVEPVSDKAKKGDLILFEYRNNLVIHRLIKVSPDGDVATRGDNCLTCEHIKQENILGKVTKIYRKNKTINEKDKLYRIYVKTWNMIFPIRCIYYKTRITLAKVKRHVLHKTGRY